MSPKDTLDVNVPFEKTTIHELVNLSAQNVQMRSTTYLLF